jgi:hypothetical protein
MLSGPSSGQVAERVGAGCGELGGPEQPIKYDQDFNRTVRYKGNGRGRRRRSEGAMTGDRRQSWLATRAFTEEQVPQDFRSTQI